MFPIALPAPSSNEIHLFTLGSWNLTVAYYGMFIAVGILVAYLIGTKRYQAKGGTDEIFLGVAVWSVIFGIIGGRLYHVITDYQLYFGEGKNPWQAFNIRGGGLGIIGAIALGGVGALWACHRRGVRLLPLGDALVPGLLCAQAIGRLGNYFNQELFGSPTTLPWGLRVDSAHIPSGYAADTLFHPTFLYEMLWCLGVALLLVLCEKPLRLYGGQMFAAYVALYSLGRLWIENLRIDSAHIILGMRLNMWTSLILLLGAVSFFLYLRRRYTDNPDVNSIYVVEQTSNKSREDSTQQPEITSVSR